MSYQLLANKISFGIKGFDIVPEYKNGTILVIKNRLSSSDEIFNLLKRLNGGDIITLDLSSNEIKKINISIILGNLKFKTISKIFTIGGGTIIDFSKRIKYELEDLNQKIIEFYVIPSRLGSGAESSSASIINFENNKDIQINNNFMPSGVIYINNLYKSLHYDEISMGAIDATTHCIESMLSINKNSYLDFLSSQTINYVYEAGIYEKMINNSELEEFDLKNLSILSFNGGIAQNNAGSGLCHALAHAAETMTSLSHVECINYFFSSIISYINLEDKYFSKKFNPEIIDSVCQVTEKLKLDKNFVLLDNIVKDEGERIKLIEKAKKDPCWRLYKNKVDINLLIKQISK